MDRNPFAPAFKNLPETIPVFPLTGVLLLPEGHLPLNIFEKRYLKMTEDALAGNRLIGMVQPRKTGPDKPDIYDVGCAGKITDFSETEDGRYLITLTGICRFKIAEELDMTTPYRQVRADWADFRKDIESMSCLDVDREKLMNLLQIYFTAEGLSCDWDKIKSSPDGRLITCLSMVCPFEPQEKQALLEAPCCVTRAKTFMAMLELAVHDKKPASQNVAH